MAASCGTRKAINTSRIDRKYFDMFKPFKCIEWFYYPFGRCYTHDGAVPRAASPRGSRKRVNSKREEELLFSMQETRSPVRISSLRVSISPSLLSLVAPDRGHASFQQ